MTTFLNIAILLTGSLGTLSAFGGETWKKGEEPFFDRVTKRGWISLFCLVFALILGTSKEIRSNRKDSADEVARRLAEQKAQNDQNNLMTQLQASRNETGAANATLNILRDQLGHSQKVLDVVSDSLISARQDVKDAREDTQKSGNVNLISAMSAGDRRIRDLDFYIPLTRAGTKADSINASFLPVFSTPGCKQLSSVLVTISGGLQHPHDLWFDPDDLSKRHFRKIHGRHEVPDADEMLVNADDSFAEEIGQHSTNSIALAASIHDEKESDSGSELLATILHKGIQRPASPIENDEPLSPITISVATIGTRKRNGVYPKACEKEVRRYYQTAFDRAYYGIHLSGEPNMTVFFRLKARVNPTYSDEGKSSLEGYGPVVRFWIEPNPFVIPGENRSLVNIDWDHPERKIGQQQQQ